MRVDAAAQGGRNHSERVPGAHTWLAAMRGDTSQLAAERAMLRGAASIDLAAVRAADGPWTRPADGAPVAPGQALTLDIVVRNERTGHRFPGGVVDAQDTWIELRVTDVHGVLLADAGADHGATSESDRTTHVLRALQADDEGHALLDRETDRFRTPVYNHTLAPRDAEVVRYELAIPRDLAASSLPLRVSVRLRHRARNLEVFRATCAESKTPRGAAFVAAGDDPGGRLDACAPEPITEVAESETWIGGPAPSDRAAPELPTWRRLYDHALGLSHALQEDVDDARASLAGALDALASAPLPAAERDRDRAIVLQLWADVATREGRTDEALERLADAERSLPGQAAVARATADALAGIWRWSEAMAPMERAASASPLDDALWARLAVACGSGDDPRAALTAAAHGLELSPRDGDLLRVQALAVERLGASPATVEAARAAFAAWHAPDSAPAVKNACARRYASCALERLPVHVHPMRPAARARGPSP
jgi:hypothetical protein